jgi:hypothetical protein
MEDKSRQERLAEYFKGNPDSWNDLVEEMDLFIETAESKLKSLNCQNREYYAGYCSALEE